MPDNRATIWQEATGAGRGVLSLLTGDKRAASHFALTQRGLVSSFIPILALLAVELTLLTVSRSPQMPFGAFYFAVAITLLTGGQIGFLAIGLRMMRRSDALIPYIIVLNWVVFYLALAVTALQVASVPDTIVGIAAIGVALYAQVNIGRLIVGVSPLRIALLIAAQCFGALAGMIILGLVFPLSQADLAALQAMSGSLPG